MRKKIWFQNSWGEKGEKDYIVNGYKSTFGIFVKEFTERRIEPSPLLKKQLEYVNKTFKI